MSEIPKWQASIHFLYPGEATSGRMAVYLAADVDAAIAAAEQRVRGEYGDCMHLAEMYVGETKSHGSVIECLQCGQLRTDDSQVPPRPLDYAAALAAAREAVAQLPRPLTKTSALAVIDNLKDTHITTVAP